MTTARIQVNGSKNMGQQVLEAVSLVRQAQAQVDRIKSVAAQSSFGNDWAAFEAEFGLPANSGQNFFTLFNSMGDFLHAAPIDQFCAQVDQG